MKNSSFSGGSLIPRIEISPTTHLFTTLSVLTADSIVKVMSMKLKSGVVHVVVDLPWIVDQCPCVKLSELVQAFPGFGMDIST